jgi:hypothetical protein
MRVFSAMSIAFYSPDSRYSRALAPCSLCLIDRQGKSPSLLDYIDQQQYVSIWVKLRVGIHEPRTVKLLR